MGEEKAGARGNIVEEKEFLLLSELAMISFCGLLQKVFVILQLLFIRK